MYHNREFQCVYAGPAYFRNLNGTTESKETLDCLMKNLQSLYPNRSIMVRFTTSLHYPHDGYSLEISIEDVSYDTFCLISKRVIRNIPIYRKMREAKRDYMGKTEVWDSNENRWKKLPNCEYVVYTQRDEEDG